MWRMVLTTIVVATIEVSSVQPPAAAEPALTLTDRHIRAYCGPCGCLHVDDVYHHELRSTYGLTFDPRNYDATEPYYYFGPLRAYPRYFVAAWTVRGCHNRQ